MKFRNLCRGLTCALLLTLAGCSDEQQGAPAEPVPEPARSQLPDAREPALVEPLTLKVLDISERERNGKNGIAVTLSEPLAGTANLQPYFTLETVDGSKVDGAWVLGDNATQVWFMNVEPEMAYRVRVSEKLSTGAKLSLGETREAVIKTRALPASVSFASEGSVLPLGYASGLPVVTVNVAAVDVDFFRVRDEALPRFLERGRQYGRATWASRYLTEYSDLVYSARFDLNPAKNTRTRMDLPLREKPQLQKPGLYLAIMREPGTFERTQITWFALTDIGLHLRQYQDVWRVQVNSLTSGAPLAGVELTWLNDASQSLAQGATDAEGVAEFAVPSEASTLTAKLQNQFTLLDLRRGVLDLTEYDLGRRPQLPVELFLYGPRDLYRPGEAITVAGLIRDGDGRATHAPVLDGSVLAPDGSVIKQFKWSARESGYYQFDWVLPEAAATGRWQVKVSGALAQAHSFEFHVEEFLPERLEVFLGKGQSETLVTEPTAPLTVPIKADYLYGAPAAGNRASGFYQVALWREAVAALRGFQFGDVREAQFVAQEEVADIQLSDQGEGQWQLASTWGNSKSPLAVRFTASVFESGGRAVTRNHRFLLWPSSEMLGIRPDFAPDTHPPANSNVAFELVNANQAGEKLAATGLEVTLVAEDRQYFWEYNDHEGWHWNWTEKEFPVSSQLLDIAAGETAKLTLPVTWGRYRLEVRDPASGRLTSVQFFAGNDWYYDWKNAAERTASRPDKINLALDKAAYHAGDTAELKVLAPAAGDVLVMVEGERPLWSARVKVGTDGGSVEIPIGDDWARHDLYVTALAIEPIGASPKITPKRSLGILHLPLAREARRLELGVEAPAKAEPLTTVAVEVKLAEPAAERYLTVAAVDVGALNISDFATPDPFAYFFGQRRYAPELKDMYGDVIEYSSNSEARERFGGDTDLVRGGARPDGDVQIVSLFSGPVAFDAEGSARVPLTLPDFNGRLRLMALAFGADSFGSAQAELTVAEPVVTDLATPRFLAYGDVAEAVLDVRNMTGEAQALELEFTASGALAVKGETRREITLDAGARTTWTLSLEATAAFGQGRLQMTMTGVGSRERQRTWTLGVRPAYPAVTRKLQPLLAQGETLTVRATELGEIVPGSARGQVQASPTLNLNLRAYLSDLFEYPYGCLEQTVSRAMPLLAADKSAQNRFGLPPLAEAERFERIAKAVERVAGFARPAGGFGLWGKDSPEEHWLTVYTADFLLQARSLGVDVPEPLLDATRKRLSAYLESSGALLGARWSGDPQHYAFATRAYAAYVLARVNLAPLGALRTLYRRDFEQAASGLPKAHLGLALLQAGDPKSATEALGKALAWRPGERTYLGDYGSPVRDLAQITYLLLRHAQFERETLAFARQLQHALRARTWLSTQETSALFLAGLELGEREGGAWQASWAIGDDAGELNATGLWQRGLSAADLDTGFRLQLNSSEPLFTQAWVQAYPRSAPPAADQGIAIARNWYTTAGEPVRLENLRSGQLLLAHLAVTAAETLPDALVVNLLPAGLELENQNLEHAIKLDDFSIGGRKLTELRAETDVKHEEYRDDRYVAALALDPHRGAHLFFLVRAVSPGTFQVPPALAEDMYRPDIRGVSETEGVVEVAR